MTHRPFIRRRSRRLLSYTTVFGIGFILAALQAGRDTIWLPLVWGFQTVVQAEGASETFEALQLFLLLDLPPFAFTLLAIALIAFVLAFIATIVAITLVPMRFQAYLDGMVGSAAIILVFEGLGLGSTVRATFGNIGSILFCWAAIMSTSSVVWKYLPFGFSFKSSSMRAISLPLDKVADRMIPGRAPGTDLADIDLVHRPPKDGENAVFVEIADKKEDGTLAFTIHHDGQKGFVRGQDMSYALTSTGPETTEIAIKTTLTGMAPMSLWDFWSRNFAEDYADHLEARLHGGKDKSLYGHLQAAARRKIEKKQLKTASA
ncbi:hypothetical protein BOA8489_00468 [Boseongicola aestuarii]|uniref:Uncharacterized protein n=1 Tax=Boseongicola aestuarii TaxID=1470561 RepID=A0A238IWL6_9RHOB|nr:hypothetical protein BOA8489_00468 [Boseongicola aestuarii]